MNETTAGVTTIHDSTANGLDGTSVASSDAKADGAVGRARFITSNTTNKSGKPYDSGVTVDMTDDPDKLAAVDAIVPEFTASFWVRPQNNAQWWYFITRKAADLNPGWGLQNGSDGNNSSFKVFRAYGSTETDSQCMNLTGVNGLVKGTWTKIDAVWMADKAFKLYVNGILAKEGTLVNAAENGDQTKLGIGGSMAPPPLDQNLSDNHKNGRGVYGDMDEVRLAAGAATVGCCANMVGFAVISYRENRFGGLISQGIGTSMLQMPNIVRHPVIWLPAIISSAILGPVSTMLVKMTGNAVGSGMGTSGLVGPIQSFMTMTEAGEAIWLVLIKIVVMYVVLPAIISLACSETMRKLGWIKPGYLSLNV